MKKITFFLLLVSSMMLAQIPAGYYNSANGLSGYPLKTELKNIISSGYNAQSYSALITLYTTSDNDAYFDNGTQTNTILDMYSENPSGADPYNYSFSDNCGNVGSNEGVCYNREHLFPQGFFNSQEPMRSDAHHVIPTDGRVNGLRGSFPFGEVNPNGAGISTTLNGSQLGPSITPGFNGTVFEPLDEFKGDIARALLYFATRYEDNYNDSAWDNPNASNNNPMDGSQDQYYEQWYIDLLLSWHAMDPVSQKEIDRNNDIYIHQNNRNPYVDNPQYVTMIWTASNNPSGELFVTLSGNYVDTNGNNTPDAGDEVVYNYSINNIGSTTLYNISSLSNLGSFANGMNPIASIPAGNNVSNPYGALTYVLTSSDFPPNNANCLVSNQLSVTANFNAAGTNGGLSTLSDDPNDFSNQDTDNDNLPDDPTEVRVCPGSNLSFSTLFISEYIEGSGLNKAIELSNWTGATIDLTGYSLMRQANGGGTWTGELTLSGLVMDQDVYVISNSGAGSVITAESDLQTSAGALAFNGNDPVGLFLNGNLIDIVGDFDGGSADFAADQTLVRKSDIQAPIVPWNKTRDWIILAQDDFSELGMHDAIVLSEPGLSFENISIYPNPSRGVFHVLDNNKNIETVEAYDLSGRKIEVIYQNDQFSINTTGIFIVKLIAFNNESTSFKVIVQ